jgi:uncharacterized tellurite resistance protein B-like protein
MPSVILYFCLIVVLTAVISLAILYTQFRAWRPYLWKQNVLRRIADLRGRKSRLTMPDPDGVEAQADRLAAELFDRHLQTISADRLADFPGIGPGTVERVRGVGGRTLADLPRLPFQSIMGIGPSKAHDLRAAVTQLIGEARSRFDAGGCPEAVELRRKLAGLQAQERERAAARQQELVAVERALRSTRALLVEARDVTFWNFLFRRTTIGPTDETMSRPLPSAEPAPVPPPVGRVVRPKTPPPPPVPVSRPVAAKPVPQAAFPPISPAKPTVARPAPADIFAAELASARPPVTSAADTNPDVPKLWAYARFGYVVAKSDGRVAQAEVKVIRSYLDERFGHDPVLVRHIDPLMERTEGRVPPEAETLADVRSVTTAAERQELYRFAERIADASGERNRREQGMLARVAVAFGLTPPAPNREPLPGVAPASSTKPDIVLETDSGTEITVASVRGRAPQRSPLIASQRTPSPASAPAPPIEPRALLEIDPGTEITVDLIRRRFALLSERLDPAKAAAMGPEFAKLAAEKQERLRAAAEALLAPFGEPLKKPALPPSTDLRHNPDLDDAFGG